MLVRTTLSLLAASLALGCYAKQGYEVGTTAAIAAERVGHAGEVERAVIRTGALELRVKDVDATRADVERIVKDAEGLVADWSVTDRWLAMTVRVPEPRLDASMERVAALGRVVSRSLSSRDVTEQLIDLEARLRNLHALRDRLRGYLQQAGNLEEILGVERELARVQTEIEQIEAKLELLRGQVTMSDLTIRARQRQR